MSNNYQIYSGFVEDVDKSKYGGLNADRWLVIWYSNTLKYSKNNQLNLFGPDIPYDDRFVWLRQLTEYPNPDHIKQHGHTQQHFISVPTISINSLLKNYTDIDRLYVDAEGSDIDIINSIDLEKFDIPYIMFEYIHSDGPLSWGGQKYDLCVKRLEINGYIVEKSGYNVVAIKQFNHK